MIFDYIIQNEWNWNFHIYKDEEGKYENVKRKITHLSNIK